MRSHQTLTVISLAWGIRSSILALMTNGACDPTPNFVLFADTRWGPLSDDAQLECLKTLRLFPSHIVGNGRSLVEDVKVLTSPKDWPHCWASYPNKSPRVCVRFSRGVGGEVLA